MSVLNISTKQHKLFLNMAKIACSFALLFSGYNVYADEVQIINVPAKTNVISDLNLSGNPSSHSFGIGKSDFNKEDSADYRSACFTSFNKIRSRMLSSNTQSVILLSHAKGIEPFITLQSKNENQDHYVLWQSLNGDIRGYALRNDKGFDYANNIVTPLPLSWHPTLIWDRLFGSQIPLTKYSCVLTGRTRIMGRKVSLLRLVPQDGLRYSYLIAKEDESDFPVELSIVDPTGVVVSRLTTMDSRIIAGSDFPIRDEIFDRISEIKLEEKRQGETLSQNTLSNHSQAMVLHDQSLAKLVEDENKKTLELDVNKEDSETSLQLILPEPTKSAGVTANNSKAKDNQVVSSLDKNINNKLEMWPELNIPPAYILVDAGKFLPGGENCVFQEYSDGLTSFRVYKNDLTSINYPIFTNGSLTILRKNNQYNEYSIVGEVPPPLAEFILAHISDL